MEPTNQTDESVSPGLPPKYIDLGTDESGRHHCLDTTTDTVHLVDETGRVARLDLDADPDVTSPETYIAKYGGRDGRDWHDLRYGRDAFLDQLAEAV